MKKLTQISATVLILLAFQFQTTRANTIFENDSETDLFIHTIFSDNNSMDNKNHLINNKPEVILAAKRISEKQLLSKQKSESNLNTDFELEILLEDWMTNVDDKTWLIDKEDPLQIENWMFDPCSWICVK